MNQNQQLQTIEAPGAVQVARPEPSVALMLQAVIDKGVSQENVAALDKLVSLYEHMQDKEAERQFAAAFVALQADIPTVKAVKAVPGNHGEIRYKYSPYEDIMEQVRPFLQRHGFTVTFSTEFTEARVVQHCTLQHVGGHKRTNSFAARIGSGPPCASPAQADGAASTYAKRFALCNALNIVTEVDTDARAEGDLITAAQAEELQRRVTESESNAIAFLKFCGVTASATPCLDDYKKIRAAKYEAADLMLRKKESKGR